MMKCSAIRLLTATWLGVGILAASGQQGPLETSGQIVVHGQEASYVVHHLPASSFPQLPASVQGVLNQRGCLIPQTYEAHRPENVVETSLERRGSMDWAVLCSERGTVSLLVFFGDNPGVPYVLATAAETARLESYGANGTLGFDWGIDSATPEQVHEAQAAMRHPPPRIDHDALTDSIIDQTMVYHYYAGKAWTVLKTQE
jgi:hypothetical protein